MIRWEEPGWNHSWLTPARLYHGSEFVLDAAEIARRGEQEARAWRDTMPRARRDAGKAWVLVGGAGFLGARIAALLLHEAGDAPVVIVSRHPEHIAASWTGMVGAGEADRLSGHPRLHLVRADICSNYAGWMRQVPAAAVIIHLAAKMHAIAGWDRLAPMNLWGLRMSVALARRDGARLQLASTLSIQVSSNMARADEAMPLPAVRGLWLHGGYAQTKAAAEHALAAAGLEHWRVVRYGLLIPESGRPFPAEHFAPVFAKALAEAGALPDRAERAMVDLTPVDRAAAAAIRLARAGGPRFVHMANPTAASLAQVVEALAAVRGNLPIIAQDVWRERVDRLPATMRALLRSAFHKSRFLETDAARGPLLNMDLFQSTHRRFVAWNEACDMPTPNALLPGLVASMLAEGQAR